MTFASDASNVLATCYPLTCTSEECASDLLASQKRREEIRPQNPPSQGMGIRAASTVADIVLRPYQANAVQNCRLSLAGGLKRVMLCSPTGSGKTEIGMAFVKGTRLKGRRV